MKYLEASSKEGTNVDELFLRVVRAGVQSISSGALS